MTGDRQAVDRSTADRPTDGRLATGRARDVRLIRDGRGERPRASLSERLRHDDSGSILPLVVGFVAIALIAILVTAAATSLQLARSRLFTLADGAALAGAEAFDLAAVRVEDGRPAVHLDDRAVRREALGYLAAVNPPLDDVRLERAESADGRSASVTLSCLWHPPVLTLLLPDGARVEVTSTARSVLGG